MAKKITIQGSNLLSNLSQDWGGTNDTGSSQTIHGTQIPPGAEWGMNRGEVERFIKSQLGAKAADFRFYKPDGSNFFTLYAFATKEEALEFDNDHDPSRAISYRTLEISTSMSDNYSAQLSTSRYGSSAESPFVIKRGSDWLVPVRLMAWKIQAGQSDREYMTGISTTLIVERSTDGTNWTQVRTATIQTTDNSTVYPNSINIGPSLDTGADARFQVRLRIVPLHYTDGGGNDATLGAQAVIINVRTVTLSVSLADNEWQLPKQVASGAQSLPDINFTLQGAVTKTLHVQITNTSGVVAYEQTFNPGTAVGTYAVTPYDSTGTMGICNSGVHEVRAWMTCSDGSGGTLTSDTIIHQIMVVNAGQQAAALLRRVLIQGMAVSVDNFVQTKICDYMVWNPKLVSGTIQNDTSEQVHFTFVVANASDISDEHEEYLSLPVSVTPGEKLQLVGIMEVESQTASDTYNAYLHAVAQNGDSLLQQVEFLTIDNTAGFQPVSGAVFHLNPKTRNNGEQSPQTIINARTGAVVASTWTGFKMDDSDGYTTDEEGNKVLRVPAGRSLAIQFNPFNWFYTAPQASKALTIDINYRNKNVTNETDPILRIAEFQAELNAWLGLLLRPMDGTMVSVLSGGIAGETDFRWAEDRTQHLSVTVIPNVLPNAFGECSYNNDHAARINNTINLVRVYINGVIVRELTYTPGNATEFCTGEMSNGGIIIGQSGADIDIYGIRVWQTGLSPQQVLQNYISALPSSEEKRRVKAENDILRDDNSGRLSLAKCRQAGKNVMVWHGDMPLIDNDSKKGWIEISRYDYNGTYMPEYSGTICKETKNLKAKGQGTTAMTYYYWNMQVKLGDVTDMITIDVSMLHSSITATWDASYEWLDGDGQPTGETGAWKLKGGCLGKNFPLPTESAVAYHGTSTTVTVPDGWIDGNGKYRGMCWQNGPNRPLSQKLVLKINYASSMQSHLIGVNWLYNTLHTAFCGENSLQAGTPASQKAQVAKQVEPILLFTAGRDVTDESQTEGQAIYQGPGGFGPGKMDKPTWGYVKSAHPLFAMFEGAANNTVLSDFLAPWDDTDHTMSDNSVQPAKVKYFLHDPVNASAKDPESFYYRHTVLKSRVVDGQTEYYEENQWEKCIGFDAGKTGRTATADGALANANSCDDPANAPSAAITAILRNASNYVYLHNPNINLYRGTFADFQQQTFSEWQMKQKWVCRSNGNDASNYLLKRYDFCERRWVDAGLWNTSTHSYDPIDIRYADGMNWDSMTAEEKADHAAVLAKYKRLLIADAYPTENNAGIGQYFKVESLKFHYAFQNLFIAGTDNCSKNTYYVIDPVTMKIELHQDDVDTVLATDNYGYQTKPYYIDRMHPYPDGSSVSGYDGMQNGLFDLVEAMWMDDNAHTISQALGQILSLMADLNGGIGSEESDAASGVWKAINRYIFDIQRYIPKAAYNEAARIRYEFPAALGYTGRDGQARPLAQSMGDQLEAEIQFMRRRLVYMASFAGFGEFSPSIGAGRKSIGVSDIGTTFSIPVTALPNGDAPVYVFTLRPHQYLYPVFYKESQQIHTHHRTAPGEAYVYTISGLSANDYALVLPALNYFRSIGNVGDMSGENATFRIDLAGSRLTEFICEPTLYYPASGPAISASAYNALADKSGYKPAFRPKSVSVPDAYGATRVRTLAIKGCPTIQHSAAIPLDLRRLTLCESIDITGTPVTAVRIPETATLATLRLPATLTALSLTGQPSLATLEMEGHSLLTQFIVTDSPLIAISLRGHVLAMMGAGADVSLIRLHGIDWTSQPIEGDVMRWLLSVGTTGVCDLKGRIALVSGTFGVLYYNDVVQLIERYGDIRSGLNDLYVSFGGTNIAQDSMSIEGKKYINTDVSSERYDLDENDLFHGLGLLVASGNNVGVATNGAGRPVANVVWSLNDTTHAEFRDPYSPVLHLKHKGSSVRNIVLTVTARLTNTSGEVRQVSKVIGLWNRIPEVGDYAWTDGQFDNTNDTSKQLAGMVIRRTAVMENGTVSHYKLDILSAANTTFQTSQVSGGRESAWGPYPTAADGIVDTKKSNGVEYVDEILEAVRIAVQGWVKPSGINYTTAETYKTDVFDTPLANLTGGDYLRKDAAAVTAAGGGIAMQDDQTEDGYKVQTLSWLTNKDLSETENRILMSYADKVLEGVYNALGITDEDYSAIQASGGCDSAGIPKTTQGLYQIAEMVVQKVIDVYPSTTYPYNYRELLFMAARRCNVWCPADINGALIDESKLHPSYARGKWMLPSSGLLAVIFNLLGNSRSGYNDNVEPSAAYANETPSKEAQLPAFANAIARGRAVPISSGSYHWSSTELYRGSARYVNFTNGNAGYNYKYIGNVVRPVTAFNFVP